MRKAIATCILLLSSVSALFAGGTYFGVTAGYDFTRINVADDVFNDVSYTVNGRSYSVALSGATYFGTYLGFGYGMNVMFVQSMSGNVAEGLDRGPQFTMNTVLPYFELRAKADLMKYLSVEAGAGCSFGFGGSVITIDGTNKRITKAQVNFIADANLSLDLSFEFVLKAGARVTTPLITAFRYDSTFHKVGFTGYTITPYLVLGYNY